MFVLRVYLRHGHDHLDASRLTASLRQRMIPAHDAGRGAQGSLECSGCPCSVHLKHGGDIGDIRLLLDQCIRGVGKCCHLPRSSERGSTEACVDMCMFLFAQHFKLCPSSICFLSGPSLTLCHVLLRKVSSRFHQGRRYQTQEVR